MIPDEIRQQAIEAIDVAREDELGSAATLDAVLPVIAGWYEVLNGRTAHKLTMRAEKAEAALSDALAERDRLVDELEEVEAERDAIEADLRDLRASLPSKCAWRDIEQWVHNLTADEVDEFEHCTNDDCRFLRTLVSETVEQALVAMTNDRDDLHVAMVEELVAREKVEAALSDALAERDSLRLELEAEKSNHRRDNEYLIGERDALVRLVRWLARRPSGIPPYVPDDLAATLTDALAVESS